MNVCHRCGHQCEPNDYACPACNCVVLGGVTLKSGDRIEPVTDPSQPIPADDEQPGAEGAD